MFENIEERCKKQKPLILALFLMCSAVFVLGAFYDLFLMVLDKQILFVEVLWDILIIYFFGTISFYCAKALVNKKK